MAPSAPPWMHYWRFRIALKDLSYSVNTKNKPKMLIKLMCFVKLFVQIYCFYNLQRKIVFTASVDFDASVDAFESVKNPFLAN